MPTVGEIEQALFELAPRECAQDWDNVGFLVGRRDREVRKVLVTLDITEDVIEEAVRWGADLIVSHHPVIFHGQKSVTDRDVTGGRVLRLIEGGLSAICMHTNLDCAEGGVNDVLARALGIEKPEGFTSVGVGRCGCLEEPRVLPEFVRFVSKTLDCNGVRYAGAGKPVYRVAVGGGACGSYFQAAARAGCDALVTADVKYDQFLDAKALGLCLMDAGHFPTENVVCPVLAEYLRSSFPGLEVLESKRHREVFDCL